MRKTLTIVLAAALSMLSLMAQAQDSFLKSIKDFNLVDHNGVSHTLKEYEDRDFIVMYIHGSGCPIARLSVPTYLSIQQEYADKNIEFLMLNSFIQDDIPRIQKEAEEFKITFPILKDADQSIARSMGVERTAEVFIIDPRTREIHFRGPINDQLGYETQRLHVTNHYLRDALETVMAGGKVDMNNIPDAKGCLVGFFLS
ncbi:MAG: redoxin domain-containing protein [Pseudohongiella sp.]|nr:redoxin domain-containing protein [Pseudohongiella sp.]MDP2380562.1 redoxin domain-containing protein [Pseudohongiella sp.]